MSMRVNTSVLMAKKVTDCGNFQNEWIRLPYQSPNRVTFLTFPNHRVRWKRSSGTQSRPPIWTDKSLTWRAGLSSGTGNALSHLPIFHDVKEMVRKRCRWHVGTHDLETREHDRREVTAA